MGTILTLFVVPTAYLLIARRREQAEPAAVRAATPMES
jgi:hypothetical protein